MGPERERELSLWKQLAEIGRRLLYLSERSISDVQFGDDRTRLSSSVQLAEVKAAFDTITSRFSTSEMERLTERVTDIGFRVGSLSDAIRERLPSPSIPSPVRARKRRRKS